MSGLFQVAPSGWQKTRLQFLMEGSQNGAWGDEPGGDEIDAICVRVADFDWPRLRLSLDDPTVRSFKRQQFRRLMLRPGDIVLEKSGGGEKTPVGRVVAFGSDAVAVTSNFVARVRPTSLVDARFLLFLLAAHYMSGFSHQFIKQNTGIQNLDDTNLFRCEAWVPDLTTQRQIADFLDSETARIDLLIEKKQRMVGLLSKSEASAVHKIICGKDIQLYSSRKDSGIPWLGDVPSHWAVAAIKRFARIESGHTPNRNIEEYWSNADIHWVSLADSKSLRTSDFISQTTHKISHKGLAGSSARILPAGTVVFTRDATVGLASILTCEMAVSQHLIGWVCGPRLDPLYLLHAVYAMEDELNRLTWGATIKTIGMPDIRSLRFFIPPIDEQKSLAKTAVDVRHNYQRIVSQTNLSITRLREFRSALITAAVTGQIDPATHARAGHTDRQLDAMDAG